MSSQAFLSAVTTWKRSRPEWATMIKAIKADASREKLASLAADAGATSSELGDLSSLRARATRPNTQTEAARAAGATKELAVLDKEIAEVDKEFRLAKTHLQQSELESQLYGLLDRRQTVQLQAAGLCVSRDCVAAAAAAGVV